jgi:transposase
LLRCLERPHGQIRGHRLNWNQRLGTGQNLVSVRRDVESCESLVSQGGWFPDSKGVTHVDGEESRAVRPGKLRYPSDLTDSEWELVEPLIPPGKRGGGKRTVVMREVVNGRMYILSTGGQWRAIPKDLPPKSAIYDYLDLWTYDGTLEDIHHALYVKCREQAQREASPTAAVIDSPRDLWSCPNAGSSSALSLGSIDVDGSPRTGRTSIEKRSRSCASPQSASCSEDFVIPHEVTGQSLRALHSIIFRKLRQ